MTDPTSEPDEVFEWTGVNTGELLSFVQRGAGGLSAIRFWLGVAQAHSDGMTLYRHGDRISSDGFPDGVKAFTEPGVQGHARA